MTSGPIVIVGAGECGGRAVLALRDGGWDGTVTLVGNELHPPYERPPLSKGVLTSPTDPEPRTVGSSASLTEVKVDHLAGAPAVAVERDAHAVVLADGRRLPYERLLLATGARPRPLGVPGGERALLLRTYDDALALRARLVAGARVGIVGGGFIGLEVAASAIARGCAVTVVELLPRVLTRVVPQAVAAIVAARHTAAGVELCCGVDVERIEARPGGGSRIVAVVGPPIDCDVVVAGVGAAPDTALAEAAGLAIEDGVSVDAELRTSDEDIYAAGDCCSFPHPLYEGDHIRLESWRSAGEQAETAASNLLGGHRAHDAVPWFWSDQYELTLQIAGLPARGTTEAVRTRPDGVDIHFALDADGRLVGASGVGTGNAVARDIRLAERLVAARAHPEPAALADPTVDLKSLLREQRA